MEDEDEEEESDYFGLQKCAQAQAHQYICTHCARILVRYHAESAQRKQDGRGGVIMGDAEFESHCKRVKPKNAKGARRDNMIKAARRDALIEVLVWVCACIRL